jgi:hypothetical protein
MDPMSSPLVTFLLAQLDADQAAAVDFKTACLHTDYCDDRGRMFHDRFGSARILAEVTAKRQLIAAVNALDKDGDIYLAIGTNLDTDAIWAALALPYADREGYDQTWAPEPTPADEPKVPAEVIDALYWAGRRMLDIELAMIGASSPFRDRAPARQSSPGCYEASFGWVHSRPSCRCRR